MKVHLLFLTGLTLIKFNYAFYDQFVRQRFGLKEYILGLSSVNISMECGAGDKCIWKCCPEGQMMDIFKTCKTSNVSISNVTVYNQHYIHTNKSLNSVFKLVPGLMNDEIFAGNALWWYEAYLIEDGRLFLKIPNLYNRWKEIQTDHFCVEMKTNQSRPVFMVEYGIEHPRNPNIYKKWSLIISTVCLFVILIIYAVVPQLRDLNGIILMIHFSCLILTFIIHSILESFDTMKTLWMSQIMVISFMHYFFKIASFAWTNVLFYRLMVSSYRKEDSVSQLKQVIKYCAYSFGLSLFLTILTATIELSDMADTPSFVTPQIHNKGNFTFHEMESLYYLYYPLIILLAFNWIVCFTKVIEFCKTSKQFAVVAGNNVTEDESLNRPMQFVKLLVLLSVYILGEMLTVIFLKGAHYTSSVYTICIGPIILVIFIWNKTVLTLLSKRLKVYKRRASDANPLVTFFQKK